MNTAGNTLTLFIKNAVYVGICVNKLIRLSNILITNVTNVFITSTRLDNRFNIYLLTFPIIIKANPIIKQNVITDANGVLLTILLNCTLTQLAEEANF